VTTLNAKLRITSPPACLKFARSMKTGATGERSV
jgi:hypothetical protein